LNGAALKNDALGYPPRTDLNPIQNLATQTDPDKKNATCSSCKGYAQPTTDITHNTHYTLSRTSRDLSHVIPAQLPAVGWLVAVGGAGLKGRATVQIACYLHRGRAGPELVRLAPEPSESEPGPGMARAGSMNILELCRCIQLYKGLQRSRKDVEKGAEAVVVF